MAIWMLDPYDTYDSAQITRLWDQKHATAPPTISTVNPRTGAQHLRYANLTGQDNQVLTKNVNRNSTSLVIGKALYPTAFGTNTLFSIWVYNGSTMECGVDINHNGITAYRGTSKIVLGTGSGWSQDAYHYLEFGFTVSDAAGVIQVKMDGVNLINLTGKDTKVTPAATPANITSVVNLLSSYTVGNGTLDEDDCYIEDTLTFHGDWRLELLTPTSDDLTEWTASSGGTHFDDVDEIPANDDTDYIEATALDQRDSFGFSNLTVTNPTIKCVQLMAMCELPDGGTAQLSLYQRDTVPVEDASAGQAVATGSYRYAWVAQETDPIAGGAWTPTNVDARRFGVKRVTA